MKRVLIYTDSRGQHTPRGVPVHDVFALRLAEHPDVVAEVVLCPMKWTTTLDFLQYLESHPPDRFDHIILQTGIVDWSPRPQVSAINDLYNNPAPANLENMAANTRDYSKKIINNKKSTFDAVFGEAAMLAHLKHDLGVPYEGGPTVNMYGLEMAERHLLPKLAVLDNLTFINSNRFVPGWEGDYTRGRPDNIRLTERYSELFRDVLGPQKVIDLLDWGNEEIKKYTCDNIHLTKQGSDWIYREICGRIGIAAGISGETTKATTEEDNISGASPIAPFGRPVLPPVALSSARSMQIREAARLKNGEKLATLIIGFRLQDKEDIRTQNLLFLLSWIEQFYGALFDVLLVEQDETSKLQLIEESLPSNVRHAFLYNPGPYNRGWGYNVAVRHYTNNRVVCLMDTDVLPGHNFIDEVISCRDGRYRVISPYTNVYFTDALEAAQVGASMQFSSLLDASKVSKPTTLSGGIVIIDRDLYQSVAGFEQYTSYGGEDRALDVTLINHCEPENIRVAPYVYVHMYHPAGSVNRKDLQSILSLLERDYGCRVDRSLSADDPIHSNCIHVGEDTTSANIRRRMRAFGDVDLYRSGRALTVYGGYADAEVTGMSDLIFPPDFTDLEAYEKKELYKAPDPDSNRIAGFYNKFKGERCFIIGNGPSLNKHDLSLLEGEYVFAVNSFFFKTEETGFRPTFYVVEDNAVMKENIERIKSFEAPYKFFPTIYKSLHPEGDNVFFFKMNRGFYEKSSPNYCVPRFSADASKVLYCGQSVTHINLQLAFFMGFTEVYLIGMDFSYVIPKEHERRGDLIVSTTDDPNHFHKDYFGKGKTWKDPKLDRVAMNYRQAKLSYEAVGRRIYNATIGGQLEIFPRVDYDSLLRDANTGRKRRERQAPVAVSAGEGDRVEIAARAALNASSVQRASPTVQKAMPGKHGRARYADFGDWLKPRAPGLYSVLQRSRRRLAASAGRRGLGGALERIERELATERSAREALSLRVTKANVESEALRQRSDSQEGKLAILDEQVAAGERRLGILEGDLTAERDARESLTLRVTEALAEAQTQRQSLDSQDGKIAVLNERLAAVESKLGDFIAERGARETIAQQLDEAMAAAQSAQRTLKTHGLKLTTLEERVVVGERQIGAMRYPNAPDCLVFFGHHKCASRFFRLEILSRVAEMTGARTRRYEIGKPPFHYSRMDELDLSNMSFDGLGENGRDIVWFANASIRSLNEIKLRAKNWKGLRVLRDPRQVLVSNYFHHKGDHPDVSPLGWVWDQLVSDKPILRGLPEEEGLLYELDHISKQVIEEQILPSFDDERILTIKLEDFAEDPRGHLKLISEFLEVSDLAGIDLDNTKRNAQSGPWQAHFTSKLREVFKERYGQALIDLGYAENSDW